MKNNKETNEWLSQWLLNLEDIASTQHTKPTVYIPVSLRDKHGSYKPKPHEKIRINWQHYHPEKKKRIQVRKSKGIKQFETLAEQKKFAKGLRRAYELMLSRGYSPFEETQHKISKTLVDELQNALDEKEFTVNVKTFRPYKHAFKKFYDWLTRTNHILIMVDDAQVPFLIDRFFKSLRKEDINATSYNNIRSGLSALFSTLVKGRFIQVNPVLAVDKLKSDPKKNKAFTPSQIVENGIWMQENDPALHFFIKVMSYTFLRTEEVMKITIGDIDLKRNQIKVFTKNQETELVPIIKQLREILIEEKIDNYPAEYSLIHISGKPALWNIKPEQKLKHYRPKFDRLKKAKGYGKDYVMYSYRHSVARVVYESFKKEGLSKDEILLKTKEVTRHKSIEGVKKYLRGIGAFVAKDYGSRIDIDI